MALFGATGTNSSKIRKGDDFATYLTLSEAVPMFSTRSSEFYVSAVFLLHCKKHFSHKKVSHECEQLFFVFTWRNRKNGMFYLFQWVVDKVLPETLISPSSKNKKNKNKNTLKKFLIFFKMELFRPKFKKLLFSLYFRRELAKPEKQSFFISWRIKLCSPKSKKTSHIFLRKILYLIFFIRVFFTRILFITISMSSVIN